ncbi:hypothetical protein M3P05_05360 [Sansalvadorimonas sp. 2012CJ34-2]|uniref:Uncharacterized protein n=1 Tax=Parendozoicomonas callyspongiae TaxID=2942213 RepID=A0ABT0PDB8_9GAMM|nr:hypothetical protein [Sansalvadorimonas sp. 2012CJ34-2]MCL6269373.1 hypothetical protein [Sansalvadorimonas sp. 2012CJ34-2]
MKILTTLITVIALGPVSSPDFSAVKERLEGIWRSDRDKTMESVSASSRMTALRLKTLQQNLGHMALVFDDGYTAVMINDQLSDFYAYQVEEYQDDKVKLSVGPMFNTVEADYTFEGNCFYMQDIPFDYREYFCKERQKLQQIAGRTTASAL